MNITANEKAALAAINEAGEIATGESGYGWWSSEILRYANCPMNPATFAAVCGSLAKKGLTTSSEHEPGMWFIELTPEGYKALTEA